MTAQASVNRMAEVAALIGDPARASILSALMAGRALTAGELAWHAGVSAQTTSGHLAKLLAARLIRVEKQGRHRYYRLASTEVARLMETLMTLTAGEPVLRRVVGPKDEALRLARTCYDHMAGRLGVALADALAAQEYVVLGEGAAVITDAGWQFFDALGLDLSSPGHSRRPICRACLDWSERRPHLAGRLGAAMLDRFRSLGWVQSVPHSRALRLTPIGERHVPAQFGLADGWQQAAL
ncbi:ArsR/SmtB family transcription factor [Rhodoligotrophos ferricapiens]|uniref:ArsR/SmtB family transcription factor n=1 Tax=Rhodoligotrophos ferricapiens TaxID=3069264 RepID=UPI00315D0B6E